MFKNKLSKLFKRCEHDFHILDKYYKSYSNYDTMERVNVCYYILYCPNCNKERHIDAKRYDIEKKKKDLRDKYARDKN